MDFALEYYLQHVCTVLHVSLGESRWVRTDSGKVLLLFRTFPDNFTGRQSRGDLEEAREKRVGNHT